MICDARITTGGVHPPGSAFHGTARSCSGGLVRQAHDQTVDRGRELRRRLQDREILVADGATGTQLMAAGLTPGTAPELWNIERPQRILALHRSYVDAGSQIIMTNTFGGNRVKLSRASLGQRVIELNQSAARLARESAGDRAFVAGDIGPTGELMAPMGRLTEDEAIATFAEQASALAAGGADVIWIESMMELGEARAAVIGARQSTELPILCSLSFGPNSRTVMGLEAKVAAQELWPLGLDAIGANCGEGPDIIEDVLGQMAEVLPNEPLIAKPNAGVPQLVDGRLTYDMSPPDLAARVAGYVHLGARIIGSCCGSTPAHIAAITSLIGQPRH